MSNRQLLAAVEAIYNAAPDPSRWVTALNAIANYFGDVGSVLLWHRDDGSVGLIASPSLALVHKDYQEGGWDRRDIRSKRAEERFFSLRRETITDRDFMAPDEFDTEPFYSEFLARHGLRYCLATSISPDANLTVAISVQRTIDKPPYTSEEIDDMALLGRHAENSLRLSMRLFDAELANTSLRDALDCMGVGVFALDNLGRAVFANRAAERLCGQEIKLVDSRLRIGQGSQRAEIDIEIARTIGGGTAELLAKRTPILVKRTTSDRPLVIYLLPIHFSGDQPEQFLTSTRAIVLIIDPKANDPADPALVRDVLGVTLGEARVAALVGSGLAPREAAARLGIGEETARTALKRVYSKVGVSRQSELTALLTKLVLR
ncbi:MAG: helix-turn-helix transcriptional regulator [Rhodopseudomonas sp.]|uniref:helix-turn-helix transcriptional regulator n=1 Tax=Rhodopseudomonas sp. TaxID=1078 RepID=UPI0017E222C6|nr:PAS domain-containing protein [Rhodopseudomonas sp.]NVN88747.1 helix-turn-helix transcriptional regulator [Rhodopseudomonas sp.]